jgi:DNA polymerase-3 subunit beta
MQFSCESAQLAKSVNIVRKAISSSHNAPIFSGIHITLEGNTLELIAMDINFSMKKVIEVNGAENGDILVPAQSIGDLLAKFNSEVLTLQQKAEESELTITSETGTYHIPLLDKKDFPAFPNIEEERTLTLPEDIIGSLIRQTVYACSVDDPRPVFTGVYMEKKGQNITCVGTNTHRLAIKTAVVEQADDSEYSLLIPARVLKEIANNLNGDLPEDVCLAQKGSQIMVRMGSLSILSSLIEGHFPDYSKPIPPSFNNRTVINRVDMEQAIQRVALFSQGEYNIVRLNLEADKTVLSSAASDRGQGMEIVNCTTTGTSLPLPIAFNSRYLMEFFKNIDSDQVVLETNTSLSPARLMPADDPSYTYIVTPVRVIV